MMAGSSEPSRRTNGSSHASLRAFAAAGGMSYDDPMSKVLGLDAKTSGVGAWFGFGSAGTLLMLWLMGLTLFVAWWRAAHTPVATTTSSEIEIVREEPPPAPPPPPEEEAKQETPVARPVAHEAPPPPAPAQAAKVLTAEPKPEEPVDLTGNTIIQGNADTYAGGFTTSNGTSANAVRSMPSPTGVPGGTGAPQAPPPAPTKDLSRNASVGSAEWNCPFPPEADTAQVDEAWVTLQVDVRPDGSPASVRVVTDPGNGFGRVARQCAMNKHLTTALDRDGNPVGGETKPFRVHFQR
jgi:protein TonB